MNRPSNMEVYPKRDLKLGIKSSLPSPKATIGLLLLLWKLSERKADIEYADEAEGILKLKEEYLSKIKALPEVSSVDVNDLEKYISENNLLTSQIEALIVAFELVWCLGKFEFSNGMSVTSERTGGKRFSKIVRFTSNMDIIDSAFENNNSDFISVLLKWIGCNVSINPETERCLIKLLTIISENSVYKIKNGNSDVIFNNLSIYRGLEIAPEVEVKSDEEGKGTFRILLSSLKDSLNENLNFSNNKVTISSITPDELKEYANRVNTLLMLSNDKDLKQTEDSGDNYEHEYTVEERNLDVSESFVVDWKQIIFYGVPGCGKSYSIDKRLTELGITSENRESHTKRVVFHPEFTNADFVGQILPTLTDEGVDYKFNAGQFTKILRDAYTHPSKSYALIIEEINRGNAASIFGDLFQLLDRLEEDEKDGEYTQGWSSYCVMNDYINAYLRGVYDNNTEENSPIAHLIKNSNIGIRLPPNLSIFATMNTSDQNVFKLDNAFKRRWELEMIPNEFDFTCDDEEEQKKNFNQCNAPIEGFDDFSWGGFRSAVNAFITDPINGDDTNSFSDKQLGTWFVKAKASDESETGYIISKKIFLNKVIEYLWDDVFTSDFTIFNSDVKTLSRAIEIGNSSIFSSVFVETVKQKSAELGDLQAVDSEVTKAERIIKPRYEMTPYLEHIQSFIQEKHPNFELNLNTQQFIGVKEKGKENNLDGNNFVYFKIVKTKGLFKFCFNVKKSDTILSSLNENFNGRFESERATKTTIRYKIDLKLDDVAEFQKYKEILTSYMEESYNHYYGSAN